MSKAARLVVAGAAVGFVGWWIYSANQPAAADTADGEASGAASGIDGMVDTAFDVMGAMMPGSMEISLTGLALIKSVEGYSEKAYTDIAGHKTIGYGHKLGLTETYTTITKNQAAQLLAEDVAGAEAAVNRFVDVALSQAQFDALVSFVYNVGAGAFSRSTMLQKLNSGDYSGAALQFARWNIAGGKVSSGLSNRRAQEVAMFNGKWQGATA